MDMTEMFDRWEKDKDRIAELEGTIGLERIATHKLEQQLAELREAAQAVVDNSEEHFDQQWLVEVEASYMKALKAFFAQAPEEGK